MNPTTRLLNSARSWLLAGLLCALTGCGSNPPQFTLNLEGKKPEAVAWEQQQSVANALFGMFGTPDRPFAFPESGLDGKKLALASGPTGRQLKVVTHKNGAVYSGVVTEETESKLVINDSEKGVIPLDPKEVVLNAPQMGLYRQHCGHCHGISGDGAGPTAPFLSPYPRDYRQGKFKFTSTASNAKATRSDIHRTLVEGIPGTAMPSFRLLNPDELDALVEYVLYLSLRGETETLLYIRLENDEKLEDKGMSATIIEEDLLPTADRWKNADNAVIVPNLEHRPPVDTPEKLAASIEAGRKIFQDKRAQCAGCHGKTALGDAWPRAKPWTGHEGDPFAQKNELDDWNKEKVDGSGKIVNPDLFTLAGQQVRPRNLRQGIYRGGRRPVDLYRRIYASIKGTAMPALGPPPGADKGPLTDQEIWHLVDYIRSMPYEVESQKSAPHVASTPRGRL